MSIYIAFTTLALVVCWGEVWFTDSRYWWLGCTRFPPCNLPVSRGLLLFYCAETGFYLQAVHFLAVHEERRKDWLESMIHHVVTSGLLFYSYAVNFTRAGVVIILIHDVSDIFLEMAKLARYAKRDDIATPTFVVFFLSWIVCRVAIFPAFVIRSTLFEPVVLVAAYMGIEPRPHWEILNGLLLVLFVLHVYWTALIFQVIRRQFATGTVADVREKDEDDD
ncbi:ASC1-like protein 1 [Tetrabaena socialis]|uniref:ASC1-like protein 1 n=1 Tax=Tetrabaena socialis TaxID=47790 RepID=A0A2J8AJD6_9CHLO|nr:ASC1-like protein 1 [Tetrabaena socialis]|eukprot:PNH12629.1 ASC1-like protein 1 [Tetrabaena socialis]